MDQQSCREEIGITMNKVDALQNIKNKWDSKTSTLYEKVVDISSWFYEAGLDVSGTAAYIKATPAEFSIMLSLSELDDELISKISAVDPPKTTWAFFANANEEEILGAIEALSNKDKLEKEIGPAFTYSEYIYQKMTEISGPRMEIKVFNALNGTEIWGLYKKGSDYNVLNDNFDKRFFTSISRLKRQGKNLSDRQLEVFIEKIKYLIEKGVITRSSIDGDEELCNRILDIVEG